MKSHLLAAALLCAGALRAPRLEAQPTAKTAVLWVPSESFSDWAALDRILARGQARFTVAVSSDILTPAAQKTLSKWSASGRLEVALRVSGDPILPMIVNNPAAARPEDPVRRIALERERYRVVFASAPAGFVSGGGAVSPELFGAFREMGFSWAAAGDYAAGGQAWAASSNVVLVPLKSSPDPSAPFVVDEADGLAAEGTLLKLAPSAGSWRTVSEAAAERREGARDASSVKGWPTWAGGYELWGSSRAWNAYGEAALAVERYQNSGAADLRVLENATDALYLAQAGRYYRVPASTESARGRSAERELRSRLIAVYRRLRQTPPEGLYSALGGPGAGAAGAAGEPAAPTDIHFSRGPSWLAFENPAGSFARPPDGTSSSDPWKIKSLRVEWDRQGVVFIYKMAKLQADSESTYGFGSLLLDTYIDLNHVVGAGSTALLDGREGFAQARDAWEYALAVTGSGALLYRSSPQGPPALAAKLPVAADLKAAEIHITVPASQLRGNPARWGYIAAAMALDPRTADSNLPAPLEPSSGSNILGLLAPVEQQRSLAAAAEPGGRRLTALRAR